MPDPAFPKSRTIPAVSPREQPPAGQYAELHCLTNYSFLEGASHPDELVSQAVELGLSALAITDRHSVAGVVRAHAVTKQAQLKLLIGSEVTPTEHSSAVLLAINRAGYGRLCRMLTVGRQQAPKGECRLSFDNVATCSGDLLAGVLLDPARLNEQARELVKWKGTFGDRCYAVAELHRGPRDELLLQQFTDIARQARVPLVAANGVFYHVRERRPLQDVLTAIRLGCTVAELGKYRFSNGERHLKSATQMQAVFNADHAAVRRTLEVANRCTFSLDELKYEYPEEVCPKGETAISYLTKLVVAGAQGRYPDGVPDSVRNQYEQELRLIEKLRYEAYFLTVYDLVKMARERKILCQGRGSAANSVVCFCLGVTSVDPTKVNLLFGRFISEERNEPPDIDIDFEHERREEVIQYLYNKYGRERAGMTAEVITYRAKSAMRDVGKALGLSLDRVDSLSKTVEHYRDEKDLRVRFQEAGFNPDAKIGRQLRALVGQLLGFPRHLSQHVGGMILTQGPLCELVPIENATMADRTVIQWDKNDIDELGILKVDCLALGMLTAIRKCLDMLRTHHNRTLELATIPPEDPKVYDQICEADTIGVFQIESRAQMSMLPRLRPREWYDLVIEVAIVRPGPIQGGMVHPFLRRKAKQEEVTYPNEAIKSVLEKTLGVPIFQEQAMRLAIVAGGFTEGEADQLRKAMGTWRSTGKIEAFHEKLIRGMASNGYDPQFAEQVFTQIRGFGEYGFPESHAASFALLVYASAWLRHHYPAAFAASIVNSQPMGFYSPSQILHDARKHGVELRPVDVNFSQWDCSLEKYAVQGHDAWSIRLGYRLIKGMSETLAQQIVACLRQRRFESYEDFALRTQLTASDLALLSDADVFRSLGESRRTAYWKSLPAQDAAELFEHDLTPEPKAELPLLTPQQQVLADYRSTRLTLRQHPISFIRGELTRRGVICAEEMQTAEVDRRYKVAGLVVLRQRPGTAKGITFMTLEDETGSANLLVHRSVWEHFHRVARQSTALLVQGKLQREKSVAMLIVDRMEDLGDLMSDYTSQSRDFH